MENNLEIINLFPIPLLRSSLPISFSKLTPFFDSQEIEISLHSKEYGERSKNTYLFSLPELKELSEYILSLVSLFGKEVLNYNYNTYKFTQSWISLKHPNQSHINHIHPNSLISGVLYYGEFTKDTPSINFNKTVISFNTPVLAPKLNTNKNTIYSSPSYSLSVSPGTLILFPSFLNHSVPKNNTSTVRKSLAFNVIPQEGFGEETFLNELKFN